MHQLNTSQKSAQLTPTPKKVSQYGGRDLSGVLPYRLSSFADRTMRESSLDDTIAPERQRNGAQQILTLNNQAALATIGDISFRSFPQEIGKIEKDASSIDCYVAL